MKKSLFVLPGVLLGLFIILSLVDRSEYAVEKRMFQIQKKFNEVSQDPKSVPDTQFDSVAERYLRLSKQFPKSHLVPQMYLQIGQVYALKGDFKKARESYSYVLKNYKQEPQLCTMALVGIGASFEKENNEQQAVVIYRKISKEYPLTEIGLNMPIYVANFYFRKGKNLEAQAALKDAEVFYQKIISENSGAPYKFNALRMLATTYMAQERWDAALKTFENILFEYPGGPYMNWQRAQLILGAINTISIQKLKDYDRPIAIYKAFIEKFPGHQLNKFLKEMNVSLAKAKNGKLPAAATK